MNITGIQQTRELVIFVCRVIRGVEKALADKKITTFEGIKIAVANAGEAITAAKGITEVPKEIENLQPEEVDALHGDCVLELQIPDNLESRGKFNMIFNLIRNICRFCNDWYNFKHVPHSPEQPT